MRQFFRDLAFVIHRMRVTVEGQDNYIAAKAEMERRTKQDQEATARMEKLIDLQQRTLGLYAAAVNKMSGNNAQLARIAEAIETAHAESIGSTISNVVNSLGKTKKK